MHLWQLEKDSATLGEVTSEATARIFFDPVLRIMRLQRFDLLALDVYLDD
jgi:hypothetical protein